MNLPGGKKYIFCVSPGRSGSHYLQRIFSCVPDVCAMHEPEHQYPEYAHLKPRFWDLKNTPFRDSAVRRSSLKLEQISDLMGKSRAGVYAETNPLFSTLWHDVILESTAGMDITVIILRRNAAAVLKSLLDLGWFRDRNGDRWMVTAYSVNSLTRPLLREQNAGAANLIIGYLLNVELYAQRIRQTCASLGHQVIELNSSQLFEGGDNINGLLTTCGLLPDNEKLQQLGIDSQNKKTIRKKNYNTPLDACNRKIEEYLKVSEERGIEISGLLS